MTTLSRSKSLPRHRWKPYPSYAEAKSEWLGAIPSHWKRTRLRHACELNPSKSEIAHLAMHTEASFLPMECVGTDGNISLDRTKTLDEGWQGFTYFRDGDVLVAKITPCFENGKGAYCEGLTNGLGFGTTELHVIRPGALLNGRFLFYVTINDAFRALGTTSMSGAAGQQRISEQFVADFVVGLPGAEEQQGIARFLDRETAKIDALIAKAQRLIELLQEKRTALISRAVTTGLDPTVPMKQSGIKWLGQIPAHWEVKRLKHVCFLETGHTPSKSDSTYWLPEECNIPWISLNDTKSLESADFIDETKIRISLAGMRNSAAHLIESGAVVFNRDGARVGLSSITTKPMCLSQHLIGWVCGPKVYNYYLLHVLYAMEQEIYRLTAGATIPTIGMTDVKRMAMPIPPLEEQYAISDYLVKQRAGITELIQSVGKQTAFLREYRTALISAAVTGKIDVRGEAR